MVVKMAALALLLGFLVASAASVCLVPPCNPDFLHCTDHVEVRLGSDAELYCDLDGPVELCMFKSPTGEEFDEFNAQDTGKCRLTLRSVSTKHEGIWTLTVTPADKSESLTRKLHLIIIGDDTTTSTDAVGPSDIRVEGIGEKEDIQVRVTPNVLNYSRDGVWVYPAEKIAFMFLQIDEAVGSCDFSGPNGLDFQSGDGAPLPKYNFEVVGDMKDGWCGGKFPNVDDKYNGNWTIEAQPRIFQDARIKVPITVGVIEKPQTPELMPDKIDAQYSPTQIDFSVQCIVGGGRPQANITWYLDDELVEGDSAAQFNSTSNLLYTTYQNFTRKYQPTDHGKMLRCNSSYLGYEPGDVNYKDALISVTFSPQNATPTEPQKPGSFPIGQTITFSGLVFANPQPGNITWTIPNGDRIRAGETTSDRRFYASQLAQMTTPGFYEAKLKVQPLFASDCGPEFKLDVNNNVGDPYTYRIVLGCSAAPAAVTFSSLMMAGMLSLTYLFAHIH